MSVRLPSSLQGRDLHVQGRVIDLPERRGDGARLMLRIDAGEAAAQALIGHDVRLNQYASEPVVHSGERWAFSVRLRRPRGRSEEHTSELQSLMRMSYAVFCLKNKTH